MLSGAANLLWYGSVSYLRVVIRISFLIMPMSPLLDELQTRSDIAVTCHACVFLPGGVYSVLRHVYVINEECGRLLWRMSVVVIFSCPRSGCVFGPEDPSALPVSAQGKGSALGWRLSAGVSSVPHWGLPGSRSLELLISLLVLSKHHVMKHSETEQRSNSCF